MQISQKFEAANFLQKHIRRCFSALLDGTVKASRRSPNYWLSKYSVSPKYWEYTILNQDIINACETIGINRFSFSEKSNTLSKFYEFLNNLAEPLSKLLGQLPAKVIKVQISSNLYRDAVDTSPKSNQLFELLQASTSTLPGVSLFLQGSQADGTTTAFSDVDDIVLITSAAWENYENLFSIAEYYAKSCRSYQNFDLLQHHGHFVLTEFDLLHYDESILPLLTVKDSVLIAGEHEINFRVSPDRSGFVRNAENTIKSMQRALKSAQQNSGFNAFQLKGLAGEIVLMPAYLFQSKGVIISKPDAIYQAEKLFTQSALEAIAWSTYVRDNFSPLVDNSRMKVFKFLAKMTCCRRYQAESLFKKHAGWVSNQHELGLSTGVISAIETFISESRIQISRLKY